VDYKCKERRDTQKTSCGGYQTFEAEQKAGHALSAKPSENMKRKYGKPRLGSLETAVELDRQK